MRRWTLMRLVLLFTLVAGALAIPGARSARALSCFNPAGCSVSVQCTGFSTGDTCCCVYTGTCLIKRGPCWLV